MENLQILESSLFPERQKPKHRKGISTQIILIATALITMMPLLWILMGSFKNNNELFLNSFGIPHIWRFENYYQAWKNGNIGADFFNSTFICCVSIICILLITSMAAYILSRFQFRLNFMIYSFFLMGLMIPWASNLLPLFLTLKKIGVYDTYWALILPYISFEIPFGVFILTGFMKSIPTELEEAAVIDGCSNWAIFMHVIIPLSKPVLSTVAILTFLDVWNEYLFALVFLSNPAHFTLSLGLAAFQTGRVQYYGIIMAGIIISIIPVLFVYILLQKQVIKGMTTGAVKG
ncbi:MAG TPA: carbohydrate ABC transporter permease [Firmicutes bacterium]|jgi:raffinose/stachyose/melibiose transport system permease protein|nr:carbohydrate ABC transporter permease [Bacillota bacterium]